MPEHRGTLWKLACPKCGTPGDIELEWDEEEPDFDITGDVDLHCEECGTTGNSERWEWKRAGEA